MQSFILLVLIYCFGRLSICKGIEILDGPSDFILVPPETEAVFSCNVGDGGLPSWRINGTLFARTDQYPVGHVLDGMYLNVTMPVNGSEYICVIIFLNGTADESDPAFLYIAGIPGAVSNVMVDIDSTTITQSTNVMLTLTWEEPFSNFDPIINYTISCSGHPSCSQDITTPDDTTRYTIPNLLPFTPYTFTVAATNSIGSGGEGTLLLTSPSIPDGITDVNFTCQPVESSNNCTAMWDPVTMGNGPLEQPLIYQVYYNGTTREVDNVTLSLTFSFSPLSVGIFRDNIHLIVTAVNRFGNGMPSVTATARVYGSSITSITLVGSNRTSSDVYSATFNCTIHPDSDVEFCIVELAAPGGMTSESIARIADGQATVVVDGLQCKVMYNITAEGRMSTSQAFEGFELTNATTIPCAGSGVVATVSNMVLMIIAAITATMMSVC